MRSEGGSRAGRRRTRINVGRVSRAEDQRRRELAANLLAVRNRLADACAAAGRAADEVTLIAVTKTFPATDVVHLAALGVREFGENRDQEAAPKVAQVAALLADAATADTSEPVAHEAQPGGVGGAIRWHFVGRLQRNKCKSVVHYADMVQSVDGVRLAATLAEAARRSRPYPLDVLVQVSIDAALGRGGAVVGAGADADADLNRVLDAVEGAESLRLRGLMAVAPPDWDADRAFDTLAGIAVRVRSQHPTATLLSAGMSGDVEQAIAHGATHVRMGSALLGNRPVLM